MNMPGFKDVELTKIEETTQGMTIHLQMPRKAHSCPSCGQETTKAHDYRIHKIKHLKKQLKSWGHRVRRLFVVLDRWRKKK